MQNYKMIHYLSFTNNNFYIQKNRK